jgi:hypothetical protein
MAKDKHKDGRKHHDAGHGKDHGRGAMSATASAVIEAARAVRLPGTRAELLALHAETRRRRNAAELGSPEHREAVELIGRIEVEIARLERAMDPPLV